MGERFDLGRDIVSIVDEVMETGHYATREDILREGVKLVKLREKKRAEFLALIDQGIAAADAGQVYDLEDVVQELLTDIDALEHSRRA